MCDTRCYVFYINAIDEHENHQIYQYHFVCLPFPECSRKVFVFICVWVNRCSIWKTASTIVAAAAVETDLVFHFYHIYHWCSSYRHLSGIALAWVEFVCTFIAIQYLQFHLNALCVRETSYKCRSVAEITVQKHDVSNKNKRTEFIIICIKYSLFQIITHTHIPDLNVWANIMDGTFHTVSQFSQCDKSICDTMQTFQRLRFEVWLKNSRISYKYWIHNDGMERVCARGVCVLSHKGKIQISIDFHFFISLDAVAHRRTALNYHAIQKIHSSIMLR